MKTVEEKAIAFVQELQREELTNSNHSGFYILPQLLGVAHKSFMVGYNEAMRWRDPEVDPPTNKDVVLVKTDNNCYATAYYHGKASGFITYGEDAYVEFGEIIGWRPI